MSDLNHDSDLSRQSQIDKIMFSFQIESSPEVQQPNQEFVAEDIIDELVDNLEEEPAKTPPKVEIYEIPELTLSIQKQTEQKNDDLELENSQLKAKLAELEAVINSRQKPTNSPETELLTNQLELAHTTIKNQQLMIETLSRQLNETQEHLVNLEREYSQIQDNYNQQTYKLLETEKQLQELHSRLLRQQRYTLEYKTVLEECFKESSATILLANKSLAKLNNENLEPNVEQPKPKSHWPSPGIEQPSALTNKKIKKSVDLPTFI